MTDRLIIEQRNRVAYVTFNRPELRNAFDDALIAQLATELRVIEDDPAVRVVVLAGNGPAFCAGADLNWMRRVAGYSYDQNLKDAMGLALLLQTIDRLRKPTIARVHGPAFAGGVGLIAACDIAIGTPEATFCLSEAKLGLSPATISPYVVRAIGPRAARRYFLSAEVFTGEEAYRLGLLSALVPTERLDASIAQLVERLCTCGPEALAAIKELIATVSAGPIDDDLIADTAKQIAQIRASSEGREGVAAFLEKRKPAWVRDPGAKQ